MIEIDWGRTDTEIIDTYPALLAAYEGPVFRPEKWRSYVDAALPELSSLLIADVEECLQTGKLTWENDYLPVLNAVAHKGALREEAHDSFCRATENLERILYDRFGKGLDVDVIFYLGLCNGAGWVTRYHGRKSVLLGIEKIIELDWCGIDDMRGLIYHELGHVYQAQYGILERSFCSDTDRFLWQLFTEGIAMYFEQVLVGDENYYHQDKNGWKKWCDAHLEAIKADFDRDLQTMTFAGQCYFGDWVVYNGHGDVGYYLGCQFVRYILSAYPLDEMIRFDIDDVTRLYKQFIQ